MNTNPNAKTILCYGDSNTWGQKPDKTGRYSANERWTGILQQHLGDDYYVVEEGLSSRTIDLEYAKKPGRNGKTYLVLCIDSHNPVDIVILMLGTNDLKVEFRRTVADMGISTHGLVQDIKTHARDKNGNAPKIIVISSIHINDQAPLFNEFYADRYYNHESVIKSQNLAATISKVAAEDGCIFLDASTVAKAGIDGLHFSSESHPALAALIATVI